MPALSKKLMVTKPIFYETVSASPSQGGLDAAFDSTLELPRGPGQNCKLSIVLRVFYRQIDPADVHGQANVPRAIFNDANPAPQLIKPWSLTEWMNFTNSAERQAALWDNKFWLVPPNEIFWFDDSLGGAKVRPNIKCEFSMKVVPSSYGAHRTIGVVNLATANFFRSWDTVYSSDDGKGPKSFSAVDQTGAVVNTQQWTVTHEVGHALGLDHIQILRAHPQCGLAVMLQNANNNPWGVPFPVPPRLQGGDNAGLCYGPGGTADAVNNIMGQGMRFSSDDAQPWLDRLPEHLNLPSDDDRFQFALNLAKWTVVMTNKPPRVVH